MGGGGKRWEAVGGSGACVDLHHHQLVCLGLAPLEQLAHRTQQPVERGLVDVQHLGAVVGRDGRGVARLVIEQCRLAWSGLGLGLGLR